jgi:hypothetical protein
MHRIVLPVAVMAAAFALGLAAMRGPTEPREIKWTHITTQQGGLEAPNAGHQQTASLVLDFDGDGVNDFVIAERTKAPAVAGYRRDAKGWERIVIEPDALAIEAGGAFTDIDGDGDLDIVFGGDASSNEVWWWENPLGGNRESGTGGRQESIAKPWKRRTIKNTGANKHHDQIFGDFTGDGKPELVFWNQGAQTLFLCPLPADPRRDEPWDCRPIYTYSSASEPPPRAKYPAWRGVNEHEGLAAADMDGDGKLDIVGGGRWFKHRRGFEFAENVIDASYAFTRAAAGDLKRGGRPEVALVVGDGKGPLVWYEWAHGAWAPHELFEVSNGHSLQVLDPDGDGNLDIFVAEMRLDGHEEAKAWFLFGDGRGNFKPTVITSGFEHHESRLADLDGDGLLDILGKPYNWDTPRLDVWIQKREQRVGIRE